MVDFEATDPHERPILRDIFGFIRWRSDACESHVPAGRLGQLCIYRCTRLYSIQR
jgi:hypothetical protein